MAETPRTAVAAIGVDIGKNSFHVVGLDRRGAIVLRTKMVCQEFIARGRASPRPVVCSGIAGALTRPGSPNASSQLCVAATRLKRMSAKPKKSPPAIATTMNCGHTTPMPAPR